MVSTVITWIKRDNNDFGEMKGRGHRRVGRRECMKLSKRRENGKRKGKVKDGMDERRD